MLIRDQAVIRRHELIDPLVKHQNDVNEWCAAQLSQGRVLADWNQSPANILRQWGRPLHADMVETLMKKLAPNLVFIVPAPPRKREMNLRLPDGTLRFIALYENGWMPEYSIFNVKDEWVPVPGVKHITRRDHELTDGHAGMKKVTIPYNEAFRGWRTLFVKLVAAKLATPNQVERLVGTSDRPGWAFHMGKDAPLWC